MATPPPTAKAQTPPTDSTDVNPRARRSHSVDSTIIESNKEGDGYLTTPSQEKEILALLERMKVASDILHEEPAKWEKGPFCLGWLRADQFVRLEARLHTAYRLSWGLSPDMDEAVRIEEGQGAFGQVLYWSDSSAPHESCLAWLAAKVTDQLQGYRRRCARASTASLKAVYEDTRTNRTVRQRKDPDDSYRGRGGYLMTVVEVAWSNENVARLIEEVHRKLWTNSGLESREAGQQTFVRQPENGADVVECHEPAVVLPGEWFCTKGRCRETRGVPPPPVVWSLSELALEMAESVAMVEAHRRSGADADAFHEELGATFYERERRFAQAEIDDLTLVVGISEELRERLLDRARETQDCMRSSSEED